MVFAVLHKLDLLIKSGVSETLENVIVLHHNFTPLGYYYSN